MPSPLPLTIAGRAREALATPVREESPAQRAAARGSYVPTGALAPLLRPLVERVVGRPHPDVSLRDEVVAGADGELPVRIATPRTLDATPPLVVHLHGGGFVHGSPAQYDHWTTRVAAGLGAVVVSVDYRMAPEHPAPTPGDDALAATRALLDEAPDRFGTSGVAAVAGDSAGGSLAALVALALAGDERLRAQWLVYPSTDLTCSHPSHARLPRALFLTAPQIADFTALYLQDGLAPDDPRVSPLHADVPPGLAAALVQVGSEDPLRDEGVAYAQRLEAAGVDVTWTEWDRMPHGFQSLPGLTALATASLDEGIAWLRRTLG